MSFKKKDYAILDKFHFAITPVGVAFSPVKPDTIDRLDKNLTFCEMLRAAQEGQIFFADAKNHTCEAGLYVLGIADAPPVFLDGEYGAGLQIFETPRAASRIYHYIPRIAHGVVNYISFAPLEKLSFDPDVLVIFANTGQAEIILRAMSYKTGKMWSGKYSPAIGCAWMYVYPYLTGELNYFVTGLGHGMKRRRLFPEGMLSISIPSDILPAMLQTLQDMPWVLPAYKPDGMEFVKRLLARLGVAPDK